MLNSVALEAVLHVDELIFSAFVPTQFQQQTQRLPPVMMRKSSRWPRVPFGRTSSAIRVALVTSPR